MTVTHSCNYQSNENHLNLETKNLKSEVLTDETPAFSDPSATELAYIVARNQGNPKFLSKLLAFALGLESSYLNRAENHKEACSP